ncbi:hypothetical protein VTN00DRAFT_9543 [Thermoascus crustaceus]|uniref:uncharacterized protein n=1 Tax=Thermoascus crustaceus TaxID=5088 RepID=UPI0037441A85
MTASKRHSARKGRQHTKSLLARRKKSTRRPTKQKPKQKPTHGPTKRRILEQPLEDDDNGLYIVISDSDDSTEDAMDYIMDKKRGGQEPAKQIPTKQNEVPVSTEPLEKNCLQRHPVPEGYVFVPKGDVYITRHCRSQTKESGRTVYVVYDNEGKRTRGLRVPQDIYNAVLRSAAETASARADAVRQRDEKDTKQARELLRAQFPAMPAASLETVVNHAFLKGSGRVGRTSKRTDERKAELAVEAHIRHTHTPYEELLDAGMDREEARELVWDTIQQIKAEWGWKEPRQSGSPPLKKLSAETASGSRIAKKVRKK